jgi:hypothetical protein
MSFGNERGKAMGEWKMNLRMWFAGLWEQLITINALDEEESARDISSSS